jgi:hypothetical protein
MAGKAGKTPNVRARVLAYLEANPNKRVHADEMAKEIGISVAQVQNGTYGIARIPELAKHLKTIFPGRVWAWETDLPEPVRAQEVREEVAMPNPAPVFEADILLTKIGLGQQGIVAQDRDGALWLVRKL